MIKVLPQLIITQFKLFFREPGVVFWSFGFPVLMAWVLGIAFANKGESLRIIALVPSQFQAATDFPEWLYEKTGNSEAQAQTDSSLFWKIQNRAGKQAHFRFRMMTMDQAVLALKRGQITLWIEIKPDSGMIYRFDPQNSESRLTYLLLDAAFQKPEALEQKTEVLPITAVGSRFIDFLVPGLMAMSIMNACLWGIGWNLVELRIKKLLRRMVATPLNKSIFLLSHLLNRMMLAAAELLFLYVFVYFYFDITIQGSLVALLLVFVSGHTAFSGIAILISSRVQNTQSGNGLINAVSMPMMIFSGIFFSYHNFPDWVIPYVEVFPLTLLANSLRGIITEGIGLAEVIGPATSLFGIGAVCFALGLKLYRWH